MTATKSFQAFEAATVGEPPSGRTQLTFLKSTSLAWLRRAAVLPGRALHLALVLKLQRDLARSETVRAQRALVASFGLDRYAERRGLAALEQAGLVRVTRRRGARPLVTVVGADP